MNRLTDTYVLQNGVKVPCVGFGTFRAPDGDVAETAVRTAVACGYRHIDTAASYRNEESVGRGIRDIPREELFITGKLWNDVTSYEGAKAACAETMRKLGVDYLDLYLIHWPNPACCREHWQERNAQVWRAMEELYREGKVRAIGVSNFRVHHLEELMKTAEIMPMVNQMRLCPGVTQPEVTAWCRERNILCEGYSPLGQGKAMEVPEMQRLAEKYGRSIAQLCIRWSLQMGFLPLPKSVTPSRIEDNTHVFGFTICPEDMKIISAVPDPGFTRDPDTTEF